MKKKIIRVSIVSGILFGMVISFVVVNFYAVLHEPIAIDHLSRSKSLEPSLYRADNRYPWAIKKGSSLVRVAEDLHVAGIISNPNFLILYARLSNKQVVQAGEYWLQRGDSSISLLEKFNLGNVIVRQITFIEGWNFRVAEDLHVAGIISNPNFLILYARLSNKQVVQAGEYWLQRGDSSISLLEKFNLGNVIVRQITFIEGWNFSQLRDYLHSLPQFSDERFLSDSEILKASRISINHPEGWFFPDTYWYSSTDKAIDILLRAHQKMRAQLTELWPLRASALPYNEPYEALIMASIVEKETGLATERARIAGVFVRRLQRKMRLETDPTVIYGLGERFNGNLRRSHLREENDYNTYKVK